MRADASKIRQVHYLRGKRDPVATGVADATDIAQELRAFYLALDYAVCRDCERFATGQSCGKCMKYFLVQGLADLADFVDGGCTHGLVSGKDLLHEMKLARFVDKQNTRNAPKRVQEAKELILDAVSELVVYQDTEMRILWANRAASEAFSVDPDRLLGRRCYEAWHQRNEPCVGCPVTEARKVGRPRQAEVVCPDGRVWFLRAYPVRDRDGGVIGIIELALDMTDRKESDRERQESLARLQQTVEGAVRALELTVETKDPYTAGHQRRVAVLARAMAQEMGLAKDRIDGLYLAGAIHDIGKIGIPAEILSKPGRLSGIERHMINTHPDMAYSILKPVRFTAPVAEIALQHHERVNGSGYPSGLVREEILLEARILAVADVIEAMASHRPYRPALGIDKALDEILQNKNVLYDPAVVDACVKVFRAGFTLDSGAD